MRGRIVVLQNADLTNSLRVSLKTLDSRKVKIVGMNMTTGGGRRANGDTHEEESGKWLQGRAVFCVEEDNGIE